jgi:formamidopyrimidine-DNA glycosylase
MPELAEVEFFRKQWDAGHGQRIEQVVLHDGKRVFRGLDPEELIDAVKGAKLIHSESNGKQMLFHFSGGAWLGVHLGMSGSLRCDTRSAGMAPGKHDHLVLLQAERALIFDDPRMFGRIRFERGKEPPEWWRKLPPAVTSKEFTLARLRAALSRRKVSPVKAALLAQELFPGVGNWMADEILWRSRLDPRTPVGALSAAETDRLWKEARFVCRTALKTIGVDWGDPPAGWLFHVRWKAGGKCPRDGRPLERAEVGGRTTAWCAQCQPARKSAKRQTR